MKLENEKAGSDPSQIFQSPGSTLPPLAHESKPRFYRASLVKRHRRTAAQMKEVLSAIREILAEEQDQITIRHLFYRLVSNGIIEKTEPAYQSLGQHLSKWRRSEDIPWASFSDSTRWHIKDRAFDGMQEAIDLTVETYRRNLWSNQTFYVEVWVEKDAIASIVSDVANSFGVPVFVCRGFASLSSLYSAANTFREMRAKGKEPVIYHFGDYDPSGVAAGESIRKAFKNDFDVDVQLIRAAVTKSQIEQYDLPTRPTKESHHSKHWTGGESVELDAMPAKNLRNLVEDCITRCINVDTWNATRKIEEAERETLAKLRDKFRRVA